MVRAVERAAEIGAAGMQIFSDNPASWRRRPEPPAELAAFRSRMRELALGPLAIHAPYLINLAGPDETFRERSLATLANDLHAAYGFGAAFLNVHIGSHRGAGREAGIARVGAGVRRVLDAVPAVPGGPLLVLENSSGSGDAVGNSVDELALILEATARAGVDTTRIGFCLDTAHLWAAGHDIARPEVLDRTLEEFATKLGPDRLAMIHLNDARTALGSRLDRHEHLGAGSIGLEGLRAILVHPRLAAVPMYLETPGMDTGYDAVNLDRAALLRDGEPLPDLPPEAFTVRGGRSAPRGAPRQRAVT